jgi:hydroxymethylbilane synthase
MWPEVRSGTRGSPLARTQTQQAMERLAALVPGLRYRLEIVTSLGDSLRDRPLNTLGAQGVFTQALEDALSERRIDLAVHSAKDLPSRLDSRYRVAAFTAREDPRDCLLTALGMALEDMPAGSRIGTGSPRRAAQIQRLRPELRCVPMRGNVDTRRSAALNGSVDGVVLAMSGLGRLGLLDQHVVPLPVSICLPQAGQGALALETLGERSEVTELIALLDDPISRQCVQAERAVLAGLAAGCHASAAAYAEPLAAGRMRLRAFVGGSGPIYLDSDLMGTLTDGESLGFQAASELLSRGAGSLLGR